MTLPVHRISLGKELGLRDADSIRDRLMDALCAHPAVEVDMSDLSFLDISIVQLLIAAHKLASGRGKTFQIIARADGPLRDAAARAGLITQTGAAPFQIQWQGREAAL
jgi:hypothetical protein